MTKNCLVTKFKGEAEGNLPIFGALPIYVKAAGTCTQFNLPAGKTFTLVHPDGTEEEVSGNIASKFVANGEERIFQLLDYLYNDISLPYCNQVSAGLTTNNLVYIKTEDLKSEFTKNVGYRPIGDNVLSCPLAGNISDIFKFSEPNLNATSFGIREADFHVVGSSDEFKEFFRKIPNVEALQWGNASWLFNFSLLAEVTNCKLIYVFGYGYAGDIYQYIQKARNQGRTSGEFVGAWFNQNNTCTLDGDTVPHNDVYGGIVWTLDTISIYEGSSSSIKNMTLKQTWNK